MDLIALESGHPGSGSSDQPGISHLVMELTGDYIGMTTADIVSIALDIPDWRDIAAGSGRVRTTAPAEAINFTACPTPPPPPIPGT